MNGGVGFSWFKLLLIDETKKVLNLEAYLKKDITLEDHIKDVTALVGVITFEKKIGVLKEHTLAGMLQEEGLSGSLKDHSLVATLGGDEDK